MELNEVIKNNDKVVLDFFAQWCQPCKMMAPILNSLGEDIKIHKIDVDQYPKLAEEYKISSIPTLFTYKDGKLKTTFIGVVSKDSILKSLK